ncbi:hypothetical protein IEN91_05110 [Bacillus velezensis]|uniref:hypothetical protein n=1 Tax=Bacillus velezensis TaxID=492670 RepID=UPI0018C4CC21|nr:hypothetical protein [Bacillus velezensis]QPK89819.1 hypothetical protein IEN91_05110 [Bacillus velezensis]
MTIAKLGRMPIYGEYSRLPNPEELMNKINEVINVVNELSTWKEEMEATDPISPSPDPVDTPEESL